MLSDASSLELFENAIQLSMERGLDEAMLGPGGESATNKPTKSTRKRPRPVLTEKHGFLADGHKVGALARLWGLHHPKVHRGVVAAAAAAALVNDQQRAASE